MAAAAGDFGRWHTIYTRMNRWSKAGVWDRVFARLQEAGLLQVELRVVALDSTIVKVHPDGTGAQKNGPQAIGKSRGGWTTKIHLVAADERQALGFALSAGQCGDGPQGRELIGSLVARGTAALGDGYGLRGRRNTGFGLPARLSSGGPTQSAAPSQLAVQQASSTANATRSNGSPAG